MRKNTSQAVAIAVTLALYGCHDSWPLSAGITAPAEPMIVADPHAVVVNPDAEGSGIARTIQEGIDMAAEGGRVLIKPGVYDERIRVTKGVTLEPIGDGAGLVTIQQVLATPAASGQEAVITVATASPVVIRDVTVRHENIRGLNVLFTAADVTIERASFAGRWFSAPPALNNGVSVANNAAQSGGRVRLLVSESRFAVDGNAISLGGDIDARIEGNEFRHALSNAGCVFVGPIGQGVTVPAGAQTNVDIVDNDFDDCGANALQKSVTAISVLGTLGAATTGEVNITGNTIRTGARTASSCNTAGIVYEFFTGRIEHNTLDGVVQDCAMPATRALPAGIFVGSRLAGMRSAVVSVRFNSIAGNAFAGLRIGSNQTSPLDATCNWWGDASGPSGIGTGTGDRIVLEPGAAAPIYEPLGSAPSAETRSIGCMGAR